MTVRLDKKHWGELMPLAQELSIDISTGEILDGEWKRLQGEHAKREGERELRAKLEAEIRAKIAAE